MTFVVKLMSDLHISVSFKVYYGKKCGPIGENIVPKLLLIFNRNCFSGAILKRLEKEIEKKRWN